MQEQWLPNSLMQIRHNKTFPNANPPCFEIGAEAGEGAGHVVAGQGNEVGGHVQLGSKLGRSRKALRSLNLWCCQVDEHEAVFLSYLACTSVPCLDLWPQALGIAFIVTSAAFFGLTTVRLGQYSNQFDSLKLSTTSMTGGTGCRGQATEGLVRHCLGLCRQACALA